MTTDDMLAAILSQTADRMALLEELEAVDAIQRSPAIRTRNWFLYGDPAGPKPKLIFKRFLPYGSELPK